MNRCEVWKYTTLATNSDGGCKWQGAKWCCYLLYIKNALLLFHPLLQTVLGGGAGGRNHCTIVLQRLCGWRMAQITMMAIRAVCLSAPLWNSLPCWKWQNIWRRMDACAVTRIALIQIHSSVLMPSSRKAALCTKQIWNGCCPVLTVFPHYAWLIPVLRIQLVPNYFEFTNPLSP